MNYNKNVQFFCKNCINIALKTGKCIKKAKKHNLILKIAVIGPKPGFYLLFS